MVMDPARKRDLTEDHYDLMRLPARFRDLEYRQFSGEDSYPQLHRYMVNLDSNIRTGLGCTIFGEPHTGKSMMAAYIATVAAQYRFRTRWTTAVQLHEQIQRQEFDEVDQVYWRYKQMDTDLLVIDDLTNEWESYKRSGHVLQFLTDRLHAEKATIVTCPLPDIDALEKRAIYPPQMVSKLRNCFLPITLLEVYPPVEEKA